MYTENKIQLFIFMWLNLTPVVVAPPSSPRSSLYHCVPCTQPTPHVATYCPHLSNHFATWLSQHRSKVGRYNEANGMGGCCA